jgi:hypothetical protein
MSKKQQTNESQLSLWQEDVPAPGIGTTPAPLCHTLPPVIWHHHMEIVWLSGFRETLCTAHPDYGPRHRPGDWQFEAGFVDLPMLPEECSICHPKKTVY